VRVQRIYVDTSVIGGYFDHEFREATRRLFDAFRRGEALMVLSTLTATELLKAPQRVRDFIGDFPSEKEIVEGVRRIARARESLHRGRRSA